MGTYKVLQDIEAEDKLLGPLSLRQFVYAAIVVTCLFISFKLVTSNLWYLSLPLLPIIVFFGMLAAPFGHDQSNEIWLLAKIRFALKPRKRLWDQSGIKELVTITVPKKVEKHLTKDFSKEEAKSRLEALANTIDSRGWAIKNVSTNPFSQNLFSGTQTSSDRLIDMDQMAQEVPEVENQDFDILDYYDNPTVGHVDQLIGSTTAARQQKMEAIVHGQQSQSPAPTEDTQWFTGDTQPSIITHEQPILSPLPVQPKPAPVNDTVADSTPTTPQTTDKSSNTTNTNPSAPVVKQSTSTTGVDPAIIDLASNDDLNVATIARQADKVKVKSSDNEVIISLH